MNGWVKFALWVNLAALTALGLAYPHLVVSPGPVIAAHQELETSCFSCHTPLVGASDAKCVACHKVKDIGVLTTKGKPVVRLNPLGPFHQKLTEGACASCHSDHRGISDYRTKRAFAHDVLDQASLKQCVGCHNLPKDDLHKSASDACHQCHVTERWKPATFKHDLLSQDDLRNCQSCHLRATPRDDIHRNAPESCHQCHGVKGWKPATFKHDLLSRAELRKCQSCHGHKAPQDNLHLTSSGRCGNCHAIDRWKPAKEREGSGAGPAFNTWGGGWGD